MRPADQVGVVPPRSVAPNGRPTLDLLVLEAKRQLDVCNACRYCEGLCAVFPALERGSSILDGGRISQLANLCHDCRACFDACMYSPPHVFDVNLPKVLSALRVEDYGRFIWPRRVPRVLRGWLGVFSTAAVSAAVVLIVALARVGPSGLVVGHEGAAGPYDLIPYPAMLVLVLLPVLYSLAVLAHACGSYLRSTGSSIRHLSWSAVVGAVWSAVTLRYLRGGGADCYYPHSDRPSSGRRWLHMAVAYGFGLCIVSTVAAGILQDIVGDQPPYPVTSVPVVSGVVGGVSLFVGCVGAFVLKRLSSTVTSVRLMTVKDYGLISGLAFLSLSGLMTLFVRDTPAFGLVFLVHFSAVLLAFAMAPYSKFVHVLFRFLALLQDEVERTAERMQ